MQPRQRTGGGAARVVPCRACPDEQGTEHERATLLGFVRRIAALRGELPGDFSDTQGAHLFYVPSGTLTREQAQALGIDGADDLFGGVVPHGFVGTKAVSHPLVAPDAAAPPGWNPRVAEDLGDAVLRGFSVFDPADALRAGRALLAHGPVRIKPVRASGGRGQSVARDAAALDAVLALLDAAEVRTHGLVLEENLEDARTFSVGQVRLAGLCASYHGVQRLARNNQGEEVFGGSDLTVARGGFDELLALAPDAPLREAIAQARRFDAAVEAGYPGFYASRRNYDVVQGRDARGAWRSGVLEQSWRVGGATGPELAALEALRAEPRRRLVRASCFEVYGDSPEPPANATVYFRGDDPAVGRLTKYTVVRDVDAR